MLAQVEIWKRSNPVNAGFIGTSLKREGYAPSARPIPPNFTVPPEHADSSDRCIWVVTGSIAVKMGDQTFLLSAGDRIMIPQHTTYIVTAAAPTGAYYMVGMK